MRRVIRVTVALAGLFAIATAFSIASTRGGFAAEVAEECFWTSQGWVCVP